MSAKQRKKKEEPETVSDAESVIQEADGVCQKCHGYGFVLIDDGTAVPCECLPSKMIEELQKQTMVPPKFANKTLANFETPDKVRKLLREKATEFHQNFKPLSEQHNGILMVGSTGSGKTHLSIAILKEVVAKGYTGLYYNVPELLNDLRDTYHQDSAQVEEDILSRAAGVDLLVLDDLGAERTSGWVRDRLYLIINRRYESLKPTIITTNLGMRELQDQVGERIVSRLSEMCPQRFEFPSEDFRRQFLDQQMKRHIKGK